MLGGDCRLCIVRFARRGGRAGFAGIGIHTYIFTLCIGGAFAAYVAFVEILFCNLYVWYGLCEDLTHVACLFWMCYVVLNPAGGLW